MGGSCRNVSLAVLLLLVASAGRGTGQLVGDNVDYRPGQCLRGDKHKELSCPEPEGPEYQYCLQWSDETCCTAEFTAQLAVPNVMSIDGFFWNRCGNLSPQCQEYFKRIECFYRCSPHVAHWELSAFDSALANLPVCHEFCDEWFNACASDMTCAENWVTDWDDINGENQCKQGSSCRNFSDVYTNGSGICETLWGSSFFYSNFSQSDQGRQCMTFWWPQNQTNPNVVAIGNLFGSRVNTTEPVPCGATGLASPALLPLLAAAVSLTALAFYS